MKRIKSEPPLLHMGALIPTQMTERRLRAVNFKTSIIKVTACRQDNLLLCGAVAGRWQCWKTRALQPAATEPG